MPDRTCCIGPDLYPVVFRLKLFQIETITLIIENKVFYPQGGCNGQKNSPSGTHAILETSPFPPRGGGVVKKIVQILKFVGFVVVFIFFFASEEQVPKHL